MNLKKFFKPIGGVGERKAHSLSAAEKMNLPEKEMNLALLNSRDLEFYPDGDLRAWAAQSFHSMVRVGPSVYDGAGNGSFATCDIKKGTRITLYAGKLIRGPLVGPVPYVMEIGSRFVDAIPSEG